MGKVVRKKRPILYASHHDAALLSFTAERLSDSYEEHLSDRPFQDSILAYRTIGGRCNVHFALEAFEAIEQMAPCVVLKADLSSFFDTIPHETLYRQWCRVVGSVRLCPRDFWAFKFVTRYSFVHLNELLSLTGRTKDEVLEDRSICSVHSFRKLQRKHKIVHTNKVAYGTPQGSPIAAVASNVAMLDFDDTLFRAATSAGAKYLRYSDDILIICKQDAVDDLQDSLRDAICKEQLRFNEDKWDAVEFDREGRATSGGSLLYLGLTYDGLRIGLSDKSLGRYYRRMRRAVKRRRNSARWFGRADQLFVNLLRHQYSHLGAGRRGRQWIRTTGLNVRPGNFIEYAQRAHSTVKHSHAGRSIVAQQVGNHAPLLQEQIEAKPDS